MGIIDKTIDFSTRCFGLALIPGQAVAPVTIKQMHDLDPKFKKVKLSDRVRVGMMGMFAPISAMKRAIKIKRLKKKGVPTDQIIKDAYKPTTGEKVMGGVVNLATGINLNKRKSPILKDNK